MYTIRALKWYPALNREGDDFFIKNSEYACGGSYFTCKGSHENAGKVFVQFSSDGDDSPSTHVADQDAAEAWAQAHFEKRIKNYLTPMRIGKEEEHYESTYSCGEGGCVTPSGVTRTKVSPT